MNIKNVWNHHQVYIISPGIPGWKKTLKPNHHLVISAGQFCDRDLFGLQRLFPKDPTQQNPSLGFVVRPFTLKGWWNFIKPISYLEKKPWILPDGREPTFTYLYPPETNLRNDQRFGSNSLNHSKARCRMTRPKVWFTARMASRWYQPWPCPSRCRFKKSFRTGGKANERQMGCFCPRHSTYGIFTYVFHYF